MNVNLKVILSIFFFALANISHSQDFGRGTNVNYTHFTLNPGAQATSFKTREENHVNIFHQSFLGLLSDNKELYLDANYNVRSNNVIGLKVYNAQKSRELTRSKIHFYYASSIKIKDYLNWSVGTQLGFANAFVGPTRSTAGGSDWALDGSMSSHIDLFSFSVGAAMHQITASSLRPVEFILNLDRYYEILLIKSTKIGDKWVVKNGVKRLLTTDFDTYELDNQFIYNDQFSLLLAGSGPTLRSLTVGGAYKFDFEKKHLFELSMSYQVSDRNDQPNAGLYIINLAYINK